jgi:hypothetical protein
MPPTYTQYINSFYLINMTLKYKIQKLLRKTCCPEDLKDSKPRKTDTGLISLHFHCTFTQSLINKNSGFTRLSFTNETIDCHRQELQSADYVPVNCNTWWWHDLRIESINCFIFDTWPSESSFFTILTYRLDQCIPKSLKPRLPWNSYR